MKILVTGANGLLGQKIVRQLLKKKIDFLATSLGANRNSNCPDSVYQSLDITNIREVEDLIRSYHPNAIINTAAMTNVDACENDEVNCRLINVSAVDYLFKSAENIGAHFIHLSTDFVFDGEAGPYIETDKRNPLSIYAKSKVESEDVLMTSEYKNWSILRTIIVFGEGENLSRSNIVLWAKGALESGQELTIVDDQFRAPTWADDLAWACIKTATAQKNGVLHISGPETVSVYNLVKRIAKFCNFPEELVKPIKSETLNQKAKRPPKTGFILDKANKELGYKPMSFEESLNLLFAMKSL